MAPQHPSQRDILLQCQSRYGTLAIAASMSQSKAPPPSVESSFRSEKAKLTRLEYLIARAGLGLGLAGTRSDNAV
jgi:hypothetical protein